MTISVGENFDEAFRSGTGPSVATSDRAGQTANKLEVLPDQVTTDLASLFKLLGDETRLRILFLLRQRNELNVRTLCRLLQQSQPAVSHHLALLRSDGLIAMRRDGKHNFYRLRMKRFEELIGRLFAATPSEPNQIRFDNHVLSYGEV
jgi:ArsR family transcriptional regulator